MSFSDSRVILKTMEGNDEINVKKSRELCKHRKVQTYLSNYDKLSQEV